MQNLNLTGILRSERIALAGLGCAVVLLACVVFAFLAIWRFFPAGGSSDPAATTTSARGTPNLIPSATTSQTPQAPSSTSTPLPAPPPIPVSLPGKIVYVCFMDGFDEVCMMDADGGGQTRLTTNPATDFYPSFSPDGGSIVFSSRRDGRFEIYLLDLETGAQRRLTDQIGGAYAPEISPDGRLVAFTNGREGSQSIWIMNIDGTDPKPLTDSQGEDIDPTWSPDGRSIAFASDRSGGGTQIHVIDLETREIRPVTNGIADIGGRSDWSPDGATLAFYAGPQNAREIFFVQVDGSNLRRVTSGGDNLAPAFSPDGEWFVFTSYRTGNNEIWRKQVAGDRVVQLTDNDYADWQPRWGQ